MLNRFHHMRHLLLIALILFTLTGVQLVQASPLHNHAQHSVDCGLCHLQLGDGIPVRTLSGVQQGPLAAPAPMLPVAAYLSASPSPYQGRAPPRRFA